LSPQSSALSPSSSSQVLGGAVVHLFAHVVAHVELWVVVRLNVDLSGVGQLLQPVLQGRDVACTDHVDVLDVVGDPMHLGVISLALGPGFQSSIAAAAASVAAWNSV
jgi:hypothetical protein